MRPTHFVIYPIISAVLPKLSKVKVPMTIENNTTFPSLKVSACNYQHLLPSRQEPWLETTASKEAVLLSELST